MTQPAEASANQQIQDIPTDPARTPEAASGKVSWDFTFPLTLDNGEEVRLPYLSPSFAEIRSIKDMAGKDNDAETTLEVMRKYLARRLGEATKLFEQVTESMDFREFGSYIEWSSNPTNKTPGKAT